MRISASHEADSGVREGHTAPGLLKVLSLSSTFPTPWQPSLGTFVRARLDRVASFAQIKVLAPVAVMEFGNPTRRGFGTGALARCYKDRSLDVIRPRWIYPPLGGCLNGFLLFLQLLVPITRLRKSFPFQIIDAHFGHPDGIAAMLLARMLGCPFTITLRGNETFHSKYFFRGRAVRWAIRRADRVITVSQRLREFAIESGAAANRVVTIPNGVDTGLFYPREGQVVRERLELATDTPLILSAGYLIERKGHHRVIQALHRLRACDVTAHLIIAGGPGAEGAFEQTLRRQVADLALEKQVHFLGHVETEAMPELMSAADVVCLASSREGWPNVVNEALACGTPVVATDIGGVPDMLTSDRYGFVVPAGDQRALETALQKALLKSWDRDAIAEWGQKRSWQTVADDVIRVFRDVIQAQELEGRKPR